MEAYRCCILWCFKWTHLRAFVFLWKSHLNICDWYRLKSRINQDSEVAFNVHVHWYNTQYDINTGDTVFRLNANSHCCWMIAFITSCLWTLCIARMEQNMCPFLDMVTSLGMSNLMEIITFSSVMVGLESLCFLY